MKKIIFCGLLLSVFFSCQNDKSTKEFNIELAENIWLENYDTQILQETGVVDWKDDQDLTLYFYAKEKGDISLSLEGVSKEKTLVSVTLNKDKYSTEILNKKGKYTIGDYEINSIGYQCVTLKNINKNAVQIHRIIIEGKQNQEIYTIPKGNGYFGRRGPSVHLNYTIPNEVNKDSIEWFYGEIEVPKGEDVEGSYFMVNGFGEGYFGIQVNSETERRILFSVWSPFTTDDPNEIPDDQKILLVDKGIGVHTGEFGNEGSGGQSYKVFDWKSDVTYKFLLRGKPIHGDYTQYTAYFYAPETGEWDLIASFARPKTTTYLKRYHSFLENFIPEKGIEKRKAFYKNQWIADVNGHWAPIKEAKFSYDATARGKHRFDYNGGVSSKGFYLENCGFFNPTVEVGSDFKKKGLPNENPIIIDIEKIKRVADIQIQNNKI